MPRYDYNKKRHKTNCWCGHLLGAAIPNKNDARPAMAARNRDERHKIHKERIFKKQTKPKTDLFLINAPIKYGVFFCP